MINVYSRIAYCQIIILLIHNFHNTLQVYRDTSPTSRKRELSVLDAVFGTAVDSSIVFISSNLTGLKCPIFNFSISRTLFKKLGARKLNG